MMQIAERMNTNGVRIDTQKLNEILSQRESDVVSANPMGIWSFKFIDREIRQKLKEDRIYPTWKPSVSETGRWSVSNPCVYQFPHEYRSLVIPPEGKKLVIVDWKAADLTALVVRSGDEKMKRICQADDPYEEIGKLIGLSRNGTKRFVLQYLYGAGIELLIRAIVTSDREKDEVSAFDIIRRFNKEFESFCDYVNALIDEAGSVGYVFTAGGNKIAVSKAYTAVSYYAQGTVSEALNNVLIWLWNSFGEVPVIHQQDEIVLEVDGDERAKQLIQKMELELGPVKWAIGLNWR